jgi:hypothetical protein
MKKCSKCGKDKELSEFNKRGNQKDGLDYYCRTCCSEIKKRDRKLNPEKHKQLNKKRAERYRIRNLKTGIVVKSKFCYNCNQNKLAEMFSKNASKHDGLASECKKCCAEIKKQESKKNREANFQNGIQIQTKICPTCNIKKPISKFTKCISKKDGLHFECANCKSERSKVVIPERKCASCGKIFKPSQKNNISCSHKCNTDYWWRSLPSDERLKLKDKYKYHHQNSESYVKSLLCRGSELDYDDIPQELVELKRIEIQIFRELKK